MTTYRIGTLETNTYVHSEYEITSQKVLRSKYFQIQQVGVLQFWFFIPFGALIIKCFDYLSLFLGNEKVFLLFFHNFLVAQNEL